jgi:hypothetical protein
MERDYQVLISESAVFDPAVGELEIEAPTKLLFCNADRNGQVPFRGENVTRSGRKEIQFKHYPIDLWECNIVSNRWISETADRECKAAKLKNGKHVNGCTVLPPIGGRNVEASFDHLLQIPDWKNPTLKVYAGLENDCPGDGISLIIRINGEQIWRRYQKTAGIQSISVPLKKFAGQQVVMSLAVDCGKSGNNISCDETFWGNMNIISGN